MNFTSAYLMLCTGFFSFLFSLMGWGNVYSNYLDKILLIVSSGYILFLVIKRKAVLTNVTMFIAAYIVVRAIVALSFAMYNEYSILGYLFPLKNWVILLNLFIIGQSLALSDEKAHDLIVKSLFTTVILFALFEAVSWAASLNFEKEFPLISRVPFIKYRIVIDEFIIVYAYFLLSVKMVTEQISLSKYQTGIAVIVLAFFISQTRQILVAICIVSLVLIAKKYKPYLTKRKLIFTLSFLSVSGVILLGLYLLAVQYPADTYFSFLRRSMSLEYVLTKFSEYPIFGYPIPSPSFGTIPDDITHFFYGFNFDVTIFPSDLPFLFILAEEGLVGLLFIFTLLCICYNNSPEKVGYVAVVLLSLIGTFRMYNLVPLGSSFAFFLLGLYTRSSQRVTKVSE